MEIIVCDDINQIKEKYLSYSLVDERVYRKELDNDVIYNKDDEKWISLLGFKEALSKLKDNLDNNIDSVFIFEVNNKKKMFLFNLLINKYKCEIIYLTK